MNFLKKFGRMALKGAQYAGLISGVVQSAVPESSGAMSKVDDTLTKVMAIIGASEAVGAMWDKDNPLPGAQKLDNAVVGVFNAIMLSPFMLDKEIHEDDKAKAITALKGVTSNLADFANCLKDKN